MLSKEEFQKELVRMWDSVREVSKGRMSCGGVECKVCPFDKLTAGDCPTNVLIHAMEVIEIVEKWSKEHPIVTNRDKLKEVFGEQLAHDIIVEVTNNCAGHKCPYVFKNDEDCFYDGFWKKEYKEPKESEEEI